MYAKIINNVLEYMKTDGINSEGCLYVIDSENEEYAVNNGFKKIVYTECPIDDKNYIQNIINEDSTIIYIGYIETSKPIIPIDTTPQSINDLNSDMTDTMGTVDALLTTFIPMMLV